MEVNRWNFADPSIRRRRSGADQGIRVLLTYLVEVERKVPRDGTIETRLEEGRPPVTETMRSASVVLADPCHARVHRLRKLCVRNFRQCAEKDRDRGTSSSFSSRCLLASIREVCASCEEEAGGGRRILGFFFLFFFLTRNVREMHSWSMRGGGEGR